MALSKVQGAQIESPVDIAAVNLTGVSTVTDLNATRVNVTGVSTVTDLNATRINVTGISTLGNVVIGAGGTDLLISSTGPTIILDDNDHNYSGRILHSGSSLYLDADYTDVGSGAIRFRVGGTSEKMRIDSAARLGIGTDNPSAGLDVVADASSGYVAEFRQAHASNTAQIIIDSPVDGASRPSYMDYATGGSVKWTTGLAYLDSDRSFHIGTGSGLSNSLLTIKTDGNIGINTSDNINGKLTIQADDDDELLFQVRSHNGRAAQLKSTASASTTDPFVFHTNNSWGFDVDSITMLSLSSDYRVGIKSSIPGEELDVRGEVIIGDNDDITPSASGVGQLRIRGNGYMPYIAADATAAYIGHNSSTRKLILQTNETDRITIDGSTGSVNIGSVTTNVKLYVHDSSGMQQTLFAFQQGTGAYGGLFRCDDGDSTQYACYGYVNTSSTYSSGGILGYSINNSKYAILGYWSTAAYYGLYSNGLIYSSGGFSSSDERLKDVSSRIEGGVLDELTSLVPVEYTWKDNTEQGRGLEGVTQIGLIAQEVEVNFPHLVMENFHTRITGANSTSLNEEIGMCKSVEYGKLTCYLLVALTEAYDKIKALEQHVGIAST